MRNDRFNVALNSACGSRMRYISPADATQMVCQGKVDITGWAGEGARRRIKVVTIKLPAPLPSDSAITPTTLTLADMLANVGLPMEGHDDIAPSRVLSAQDKVEAFAVPSWADRIKPFNADSTAQGLQLCGMQ